eukprot:587235-Pleurochrysis_carterae.AAC.1
MGALNGNATADADAIANTVDTASPVFAAPAAAAVACTDMATTASAAAARIDNLNVPANARIIAVTLLRHHTPRLDQTPFLDELQQRSHPV